MEEKEASTTLTLGPATPFPQERVSTELGLATSCPQDEVSTELTLWTTNKEKRKPERVPCSEEENKHKFALLAETL
ncbi:putative B3 domain-containing protein [Prunus yedoensis var. nudiflora]|uniref:Putative B3 domain-containing protein n=1 Tax=Prunus yedoensis var. nudiflora TaxID=2094558 RepID=A0A314UNF4_PRUYE|nr:putative B3 domain-containing protein [Prunus yedoensis var. nudiflora]